MPNSSDDTLLPNASRGDRKIASSSTHHCTIHSVQGPENGTVVQSESKLEYDHLRVLAAHHDVADLREQVMFKYGERDERRHYFDLVARLTSGEVVAYTVKPSSRVSSGKFVSEMKTIAWWAQEKRFASSVRLLTERDINPVALHNAAANVTLRDCDPDADEAAQNAVCSIVGTVTIAQLTNAIGLGARGYRAILRHVSNGAIVPIEGEKIGPNCRVRLSSVGGGEQ